MGTATRRWRGLLAAAVAVEDEVAGDGALGDADGGAGGAAEGDGGGDVADGGVGDVAGVRVEVGAVDVDLSAGHGCGGGDAVEMGCVGGCRGCRASGMERRVVRWSADLA